MGGWKLPLLVMFARFLLVVCFCSSALGQTFDPLLSTTNLWNLTQDEFQNATKDLPLRWTSTARDSARAAQPGLTLLNLPVYEVVVRFEKDRLKQVTAAFYARGDAGELPKDKFDVLVKTAAENISRLTGKKFTPRGKDATNAVKADGILWQTDTAHYLLEYSFTREVKTRGIDFRAEFVRLEVTAPDRSAGSFQTATNLKRANFNGALHLKRDLKSGDVYLFDVPMVDQGQKGYCVVATTERVMRFYGADVDANELAQIANSDATAGTSVNGMIDALKKIAARLKVRVRELETHDVKQILELIKDYNRAAKRLKAQELSDPGLRIDVGELYRQMNFEVLKEARTRNKSDLSRFQRAVQGRVDVGIPLLWCVQLGIRPEPGIPQNAGGHMRLIIGYNSKTNDILYSDSWGAGHELKRMPADDAWAITTGLTAIEPL